MLFHLEGFYGTAKIHSPEKALTMKNFIRKSASTLIPSYIDKKDMIGMDQFHTDDIAVFLRVHDGESLKKYGEVTARLKIVLEHLLQDTIPLHLGMSVRLHAGCVKLDDQADVEVAVETAYHIAMASAGKERSANFVYQHMEFEEIIRSQSISVLTQPIMNLNDGNIYGWEVLVRGPDHTPFHYPSHLFEFATQAGALPELEWVVIQKALQEIAERGITEQVFINITPVSLSDPLLLLKLQERLKHFRIKSTQIVLEITERHSIDDFEYMSEIVRSYRAAGFRFAVDDAGAGYSSLQSISELVPDIIKIDQSVIRNIDREGVKQALLRSLLYFAENINCQVIAEGVEREEEANLLLHHRVPMGQGFYFAKPGPFEKDRNSVHFANLKEKIIQMQQVAAAAGEGA